MKLNPLCQCHVPGRKRGVARNAELGHNLAAAPANAQKRGHRFPDRPPRALTNNEAERIAYGQSQGKKVSGCFRAVRGAEIFCCLRTVTCTAAAGLVVTNPDETVKIS